MGGRDGRVLGGRGADGRVLGGRGADGRCVMKVVGREYVLWVRVVLSGMWRLLVKGVCVELGRTVKTQVGRDEEVDREQGQGTYSALLPQHSQPSPTVWSCPWL